VTPATLPAEERFGPYCVTELLEEDAFARTLRVRDPDGRSWVVRALRDRLASARALARLRREFDLGQRFGHPNIERPLRIGTHGGQPYLLYADRDQRSLRTLLRAGPQPPAAAVRVALGVLDALEAIHGAQVVSRNVTPATILVGADGSVRLGGLSLASEPNEAHQPLEPLQALEGDLAYIAPEQTGRMARGVDYRADFYALGATLFEALCGEAPYQFADASEAVHAHLARRVPDAHTLRPQVPPALSAIVQRLLAKEPEARYQSHAGLRADLRAVLDALGTNRTLDAFVPGRQDRGDRLQLGGRLFGREAALALLTRAFEAAARGPLRIVAVAGYSGVGKTALVLHAQRTMPGQRGTLLTGKFDQFSQAVPYAAFLAALRQCGRQWLAMPRDGRLSRARLLRDMLASNAGVVADAVPELGDALRELGPLTPPLPLGPAETEHRFLRAVATAFAALARPDAPLTLFIDDLQWADRASLRLLRHLALEADLRHVLLVGAYRSNEVGRDHPLEQEWQEMAQLRERFATAQLAPLDADEVRDWLAHAMGTARDGELGALAALCWAKTGGNPFFVQRWLEDAQRRGALGFDAAADRWRWDLAALEDGAVAEDVIELMRTRLEALPEATQAALTTAAFLGSQYDLRTLAAALSQTPAAVAQALLPALQARLVLPTEAAYRYASHVTDAAPDFDAGYAFAHDRVQEAAMHRLPPDERTRMHAAIGRLLLSRHEGDRVPLAVVNHLNVAQALITAPVERARLADLNEAASRQAADAGAFDRADHYAEQALGLRATLHRSPDEGWRSAPAATLDRHVHAARMAYLAGRRERMNALIEAAVGHAADAGARARLLEVRLEAAYGSGQLDEALDLGLELLRLLDATPPHADTPAETAALVSELRQDLRTLGIDALSALPPMRDAAMLQRVGIAAKMTAAAYIARPALLPLLTVQQVRLMMAHGHVPAAMSSYSVIGLMCAEFLGDHAFAYALGRMSMDVIAREGWQHVLAHAAFSFNTFLRHWVEPLETSIDGLRTVFRNGVEHGNLRHAGLGLYVADYHAFLRGKPLDALAAGIEDDLAALKRIRQPVAQDYLTALAITVAELRGATLPAQPLESGPRPGAALEQTYGARHDQTGMLFLQAWRCMLHFLAGRFDAAHRSGHAASALFAAGRGMHVLPTVVFCTAVAGLRRADPAERTGARAAAAEALARFDRWHAVQPARFAALRGLLQAELARSHGDAPETVCRLYAQAEAAAIANEGGTPLEAGIAAWLHGTHRQAAGLPGALETLAEARLRFLQWGAQAVANAILPASGQEAPGRTAIASDAHAVDLSSLMKAMQAVTGEVELPRLLRRLAHVLIENAGATRAAVVLRHEAAWQVVLDQGPAACASASAPVPLDLAMERLPVGIVRTTLATGSSLLLADATGDPDWAGDPFVAGRGMLAVLCVPLKQQGRVVGALYLDNDAARAAFGPGRQAFIELLAANVVGVVESARLNEELRALNATLERRIEARTRQLTESEARLRAMLDNAPVPMGVISRAEGIVIRVNAPAIALLGYRTADEVAGHAAAAFYADPAQRAEVQAAYRAEGVLKDREVQLRHMDGTIRWVLLSIVPIVYDAQDADLVTMVDITRRVETEQVLDMLAHTDTLTGVANRRRFMEQAALELARARRHGHPLSVVMFDLDHFKTINDRHGHAAGDAALRHVSTVVAECLRAEDLLARLGGEEFAVLLPYSAQDAAVALAERLRLAIAAQPLATAQGLAIPLRASFGVVEVRNDEALDPDALRRADAALYEAKHRGRNRVATGSR
jgi:diguanylate cyclase (GGDEF)-like protein/PAS domain S-box-containing protein